jgi:uncharacterized membrane protein
MEVHHYPSVFVVLWMGMNAIGYIYHWDVYPFILLNLVFSTQAAYAAPIIMMAQNRQNDRDRHHAEADYQTNLEAKREIEALAIMLKNIEVEKFVRVCNPDRVGLNRVEKGGQLLHCYIVTLAH